ncbi:MAG: TetR/AcrR family transcriptional regulator [Myxococcota bacterium]
MSPRDVDKLTDKGLRRKQELLDSALKLFSEKGYHATTMDDIARKAGTGKGTVYWYWHSKEEIFLELLDQKLGGYLNSLQQISTLQLDASDKIPILITEVGNIFVKYRKLCKLIFLLITEDTDAFDNVVRTRTADYYRKMMEIIESIFAEGIAKGAINPDADPAALAAILVALIDGIAVQEAIFGKEYSIRTLGVTTLKLIKGGVYLKK